MSTTPIIGPCVRFRHYEHSWVWMEWKDNGELRFIPSDSKADFSLPYSTVYKSPLDITLALTQVDPRHAKQEGLPFVYPYDHVWICLDEFEGFSPTLYEVECIYASDTYRRLYVGPSSPTLSPPPLPLDNLSLTKNSVEFNAALESLPFSSWPSLHRLTHFRRYSKGLGVELLGEFGDIHTNPPVLYTRWIKYVNIRSHGPYLCVLQAYNEHFQTLLRQDDVMEYRHSNGGDDKPYAFEDSSVSPRPIYFTYPLHDQTFKNKTT